MLILLDNQLILITSDEIILNGTKICQLFLQCEFFLKHTTIEILSWGFSVMFTSGNVRKSAKKRFLFTFQYSFFVGLAWRWEENENCFWGLATFICYFWSLKNSVKSIHQYSTHHSIGKRKIELASYFWMNEKVKFFNNKSQQKPALAQYFDIFRGWFSTRTTVSF